jgi:hypothetical protein
MISDADISPHPGTPPTFIDIFRHAIDDLGFHHAGFGLITSDLPEWSTDRDAVMQNEAQMRAAPVTLTVAGRQYTGYKAPIDTTFCMFKTTNGGWYAPMNIEDWTNSLRIFEAFHLPWYIDGSRVNPEMDNYFRSAKYRDHSAVSAGKNNYRPKQYQEADGSAPRGLGPAASVMRRLRVGRR